MRKTVTPDADEVADDLPHRLPAARVQAGRRLVEEDHLGPADQRRREVEAPPHAARVGRRPGGRAAPRGRTARAAPRRAPGRPRPDRPVSRPIIRRFSAPVCSSSTAAYCPVRLIARRTAPAVGDDVEAGDARPARVGRDERRQDPDGRRLARAVGAEQREHRCRARPAGRRRRARARRRRTSPGRWPRSPLRRSSPPRLALLRIAYAYLRTLYTVDVWRSRTPRTSRRPRAACPRASRPPGACASAPRQGPKPGLSLERIVAAAIDVAASEGIAAVSMSRVAERARLVPDVALPLRRGQGRAARADGRRRARRPPARRRPGEDWRAGLSRWAWAYHDALRRHPWALRDPDQRPAASRPTRSPGSRTGSPRCATPA